MTDYTAGAIGYVLAVGFLVSIVLIGGFLILNLGLMSKRKEDMIGGRDPSDVGILKNTNWPQVPERRSTLPARDYDDEDLGGDRPAA